MKRQFPGKWAISFVLSGTYTKLLAFYTDYPNATLSIISDQSDNNAGQPNLVWVPVAKVVCISYNKNSPLSM